MWHFTWVFATCQSTRLGFSGLQRVMGKPVPHIIDKAVDDKW